MREESVSLNGRRKVMAMDEVEDVDMDETVFSMDTETRDVLA